MFYSYDSIESLIVIVIKIIINTCEDIIILLMCINWILNPIRSCDSV